MQTRNPFIDDLTKVANGAMGALTGMKDEVEARVRDQIAKILDGMDIPRRDEFDAVKAMAAKAREENEELKKQIAELVSTPIALGERLYSRWDFKPFFDMGAVDIIQPDLSHAGGILECRKIAAMAEAYDVAVAPHCPLGPLALASCLQLAACTPNVAIQEMSLGIHYNAGGHDLLNFTTTKEVLTPQEVEAYVASEDWRGKAGGYGIQDADPFVTRLAGSHSNIVGLPMELAGTMLASVGLHPTPPPAET